MLIEVTKEDIQTAIEEIKADQSITNCCPIAKALKRYFVKEDPRVRIRSRNINEYEAVKQNEFKSEEGHLLPEQACKFAKDFDNFILNNKGQCPDPISFEFTLTE